MTRILLTGGVGFIGHHLARALLERGDELVIVDDFSNAPYPTEAKRKNHIELARDFGSRLQVKEGCITDAELLHNAMAGIESVIHLAGLAGVRPSFADPARYARVNVEGTARVFESARQAGATKFLFASSSSVYGNATPLPAREDSPAITPESPYAASKRGAELIVSSLSLGARAMACVGLRFFTVYGPRQRPEMAISSFTRACLAGKSVRLFGDGTMRRDFTHVTDIVRGIIAVLDGAKAGYSAVNLGSGAPVELKTLVSGIERACGKSLALEQTDVPLGDVEATFADISLAARDYGWKPEMKLEAGLQTVVDWLTIEG